MLRRAENYEALCRDFRWEIPARYNIAAWCCDRHPADAPALVVEDEDGAVARFSFGDLRRLSARAANALSAHGIGRGDRVAVLLSQGLDLPLAHLGAYRLGAVVLPLFALFGPDALEYRLANAGAKALVTDMAGFARLAEIRDRLPGLAAIFVTDGAPAGAIGWRAALERASDSHAIADTGPDDPALVMYTSGTTGPPKGALHAHRVVLGHLPGVELPHEFFPQPGDLFWTPADWAWAGGLLDVLLPSWHHGVPVLARRWRRFDPEEAFALMARHGVRNAFLPPTALKLMRQVADPARRGTRLRSVGSGGEPLGAELLDWGRAALGLTVNEFYGQTEANLVVSNCAGLMPVRPGSMGRPVPGHRVGVVDAQGRELPRGEAGIVAVGQGDPVMFLGYLGSPEATAAKFEGGWMLTGDTGRMDGNGYLWFAGREDDVITSGAYRIGPAEVEDTLMKHPAVAMAAAVGVPDALRTEIVKAFLVLKPGHEPSAALAAEIQEFVRVRLAAHEYPREVEFVAEMPLTATGKIMRRVLRRRDAERRD